ncbi:MAG: sigma-E factor negative regulatory protein [Gammaproteobacteria bacterium]|nr:sigma-E factor negative regulatory protein [Gammaproteobacteria bacterium]
MTVNQNELLSALVDGELQGKELDDALQLLQVDEQARMQLQRYQHASDILHGHNLGDQTIDLTTRISTALQNETEFTSATKNKASAQVIAFPKPFWKQAASLAVAASIGALAVIGVMNQPNNQLIPSHQVAAVEIETTPMVVAQAGERWTVKEQEVEERLNSYLVDHNEYAGASGVFSYARVVSYDMGR